MITPFIKIILRFIAALSGLAGLGFILYSRLLKTRLPFEICFPFSEKQINFLILILLINFIILGLLIYYWNVGEDYKQHGKSVFTLFDHIKQIQRIIYVRIADMMIPNHFTNLINAGCWIHEQNIDRVRNIILAIIILPRILVSIVFLLDIFYFGIFNYFYKIMWLLLLPLVLDFIFFNYKTIFKEIKGFFEEIFYLFPADLDKKDRIMDIPIIGLKPHINKDFRNDPEILHYERLYVKLLLIEPIYETLYEYKNHVKFFSTLFWRIFYIIGWSYVLGVGIGVL